MSLGWIIGLFVAFVVGRMLWFMLRAGRAKKLVAAGAALVDVRTPSEFAGGHLPNARNVPLDVLMSKPDVGPREKAVVVYCASGTRSAAAARALRRAGYQTVVNLGPMFAWGRS